MSTQNIDAEVYFIQGSLITILGYLEPGQRALIKGDSGLDGYLDNQIVTCALEGGKKVFHVVGNDLKYADSVWTIPPKMANELIYNKDTGASITLSEWLPKVVVYPTITLTGINNLGTAGVDYIQLFKVTAGTEGDFKTGKYVVTVEVKDAAGASKFIHKYTLEAYQLPIDVSGGVIRIVSTGVVFSYELLIPNGLVATDYIVVTFLEIRGSAPDSLNTTSAAIAGTDLTGRDFTTESVFPVLATRGFNFFRVSKNCIGSGGGSGNWYRLGMIGGSLSSFTISILGQTSASTFAFMARGHTLTNSLYREGTGIELYDTMMMNRKESEQYSIRLVRPKLGESSAPAYLDLWVPANLNASLNLFCTVVMSSNFFAPVFAPTQNPTIQSTEEGIEYGETRYMGKQPTAFEGDVTVMGRVFFNSDVGMNSVASDPLTPADGQWWFNSSSGGALKYYLNSTTFTVANLEGIQTFTGTKTYTGTVQFNNTVQFNGASQFNSGVTASTFTATTKVTSPSMNVTPQASDPVSPADGDMWMLTSGGLKWRAGSFTYVPASINIGNAFTGNNSFSGTSTFSNTRGISLTGTGVITTNGDFALDSAFKALIASCRGVKGWIGRLLGRVYLSGANVNNSTVETTLLSGSKVGTFTLPASYWSTGACTKLSITGTLAVAAAETVTFNIKHGSTVLATRAIVFAGTLASTAYEIEVEIVHVSGTSVSGKFTLSYNSSAGTDTTYRSTIPVTTVVATSAAIDATVTHSVANAGNSTTVLYASLSEG